MALWAIQAIAQNVQIPISVRIDSLHQKGSKTRNYISILLDSNGVKKVELKRDEKEERILGMNFSEISVLAQTLGIIGVIITLIYLARQTGIANRNKMLNSFQHSMNNINEFNNVIAGSSDLAPIIIQGREGYSKLSADQKLRFEHTYGRLLNIIESWYILTMETGLPKRFKQQQLNNIRSVVRFYFNYPGVLEFWNGYQSMYIPGIASLIKENTDTLPYQEQKLERADATSVLSPSSGKA